MSEEKEEHYIVLTAQMVLNELLAEAMAAWIEATGYGFVVRWG